MEFAPQVAPVCRLPGFVLVVLLHVALVYALVNGLAKRIVEVVRMPVETRIIEEQKKPRPPPPELALAPPPLVAPPPPPYLPPPEIRIRKPPPPRIVEVQTISPPAPVAIMPVLSPPAPAAPPAPATPPSPPSRPPPAPAQKPAAPQEPLTARVVCPNYRDVVSRVEYPRRARREGLSHGEVLMQFKLTADGRVVDIRAIRSTHPVFARASAHVVQAFKCKSQGRDVLVNVPFSYSLRE